MKKTKIFWGILLILTVITACKSKTDITAMAMDELAYNKAIEENTIEAYDAFLKDYPNSKYTEAIQYSKVMLEGTYDRLCWYLKEYSDAPEYRANHVREAIIAILSNEPYDTIRARQSRVFDYNLRDDINSLLWSHEEFAWRLACDINTLTSYGKYIDIYPKGEHLNLIRKKEKTISNQKNSELVDIAIEAYLESENKKSRFYSKKEMKTAPDILNPSFSNPTDTKSYLEIENPEITPCTVYLRSRSGKIQTFYMAAKSTCEKTIDNGTYDLVVVDDNDKTTPWACRLKAQGSYYGISLTTTEGGYYSSGATESTMSRLSNTKSELNKAQH